MPISDVSIEQHWNANWDDDGSICFEKCVCDIKVVVKKLKIVGHFLLHMYIHGSCRIKSLLSHFVSSKPSQKILEKSAIGKNAFIIIFLTLWGGRGVDVQIANDDMLLLVFHQIWCYDCEQMFSVKLIGIGVRTRFKIGQSFSGKIMQLF